MINVNLKPQIECASTSYLTMKNVDVDDGLVKLKDIANVLQFGVPTIMKYSKIPECIVKDGTPKVPVSCMTFLAITCMNRNVKKPETRNAICEYLDFIGMPYMNIWQSKFYIVFHPESNKVKIGNTDTAIEDRIRQIKRYHGGTVKVLLVLSLSGNVIAFENSVKERFKYLKTSSPNNESYAVGKNEWYHYGTIIEDFINEYQHLNIKDS